MSTDVLKFDPNDATYKKFSRNERRNALRRFRLEAGLSLRVVAARAKLSLAMVSMFETGNRDLSPKAYNRLERVVLRALERHQKNMAKRSDEEKRREAVLDNLAKGNRGVPLSSLLHAGPDSLPSESDETRNELRNALTHQKRVGEIDNQIIEIQDHMIRNLQEIVKEYRKQGPIDPEIEDSFRREVSALETERANLGIAKAETIPPSDED